MDRFYSAGQLRNDLDPMLTACVTAADRAEVREYARLRLAGMPYRLAA
jgi:hypothetical protein